MTYAEKLKDPRWQKKRLEILQRDNWKCRICGSQDATLHVHHMRYIRGKDPWEYPDSELLTLCATCHELEPDAFAEYCGWLSDIPYIKNLTSDEVCGLFEMLYQLSREEILELGKLIFNRMIDRGMARVLADE